jgi:hypothetical protein
MARKNEQNASKMLKLKSLKTQNEVQSLAKVDRSLNRRGMLSVAAYGLLHFKLNSGKWVKKVKCGPRSQKVVHNCVKHSSEVVGNGSAVHRRCGLFQKFKRS